MTIDIFGNFLARNHPFLPVIRELDKTKDVRINLMGPVHSSILHIQKRTYEPGDIAIGFGTPREMLGMISEPYKFKLGITTWETDRVPYGSYYGEAETLNKLDLLLVQTKWHRELYDRDVNVPIIVQPLPFANYLQPVDRDYTMKPFTFLCEGTLTLKANVGLVISAFLDLYQDRDDVKLILKTDSGTLGHLNFPYKNIEIIDKQYSPREYRELLDKAHCFVYPARADDFQTPVINAMATDLPVIMPNHSIFTGLGGLKLENHATMPAERYSTKFGDVGNYWKADYDELKNLMSYAESHLLHIKLFGQSNGRIIRNSHNVRTVTSDIINKIRNLYNDDQRNNQT